MRTITVRVLMGLALWVLTCPTTIAQDLKPTTEPPEYVYALTQGRETYSAQRNSYRAIAWFHLAIQANPDGYEAWRAAGALQAINDEYNDVLFYLGESLRIEPRDGMSWYWLGFAHARKGRKEAAWAAYDKATRLPFPANVAQLAQAAEKAAKALIDADPKIAERARALESVPGAVATVVVRYLGASRHDANMRDAQTARMRHPSSVDVGQPLNTRLLRVFAYDVNGFPCPFNPRWTTSAGLSVEPETNRILAGAAPSKQETLTAEDINSGAKNGTTVAVLGPPHTLDVLTSVGRLSLGTRAHLETRLTDAAGNLLYVPDTKWTAAGPEGNLDAYLARTDSVVAENNNFEPHRNMIAIPEQGAGASGALTVTCTEPVSGKQGVVSIEFVNEALSTPGGEHGPLHWETDFARAMEIARKDQKLILADFSADW